MTTHYEPSPYMTSDTAPSPRVTSASHVDGSNWSYKAFDGNISIGWSCVWAGGPEWLKIYLGDKFVAVGYRVYGSTVSLPAASPSNWVFQGSNNNLDWDNLDIRTSQSIAMSPAYADYSFSNTTGYKYYRLNISANGGDSWLGCGELKILVEDPPVTPTNLIATCPDENVPEIIDIISDPETAELGAGGFTTIDLSASIDNVGLLYDFTWSAGDGRTWTFGYYDSHPALDSHEITYLKAGIYTVELKISYFKGGKLFYKTYQEKVVVMESSVILPPVALFTYAGQGSGPVPLSKSFVDASTGNPDTWEWRVNGVIEATTQNFNHTFTGDGIYTVTLLISKDGVWTSGTSKTIIASPDTNLPPITSAMGSTQSSSGAGRLTTTFSATVAGSPSSYLWDFGDGHTADTASPTHTYTQPGVYIVTLTVTNEHGTTISTIEILVAQISDVGGLSADTYISGQKIGYYIVDNMNHRVLIYEKNGTYITSFGGLGEADGKFNLPTRLAITGGLSLLNRVEQT